MKNLSAFTFSKLLLVTGSVVALVMPHQAHAGGSVAPTYTLVSSVRSGRTTFDYSYTITVKTDQFLPTTGIATVKSSDAATLVIKSAVNFGCPIAQGEFTALPNQTYVSTDIFTIRQDRTKAFNPGALSWTVGVPADSGRFKTTLPKPPASPCDPTIIASLTSQQPVVFPSPGVTAVGAQLTITAGAGATIYYGLGVSPTPTTVYTNNPIPLYTGKLNMLPSSLLLTSFAIGDKYYPSGTLTGTYIPALLPSDGFFGGPDIFLANTVAPNVDNSCDYYTSILAIFFTAHPPGACTSLYLTPVGMDTYTDASGNQQTETIYGYALGLSFDDWLSQTAFSEDSSGNIVNVGDGKSLCGAGGASDVETLTNGGLKSCATFINKMDLNFTRDHHAVWNGLSGDANKSAAYVCNFSGPDFYHDQFENSIEQYPADVDNAIQNATAASKATSKRLPCVAFDYGVNHDANNHPIMRFFAFDPATRLLLQKVDLDGRGPKFIPNACSACHGVPANANSGVSEQRGPNGSYNGGSYIPFDEANLQFPSNPVPDLETRIKYLNIIALQGQNNSSTEMQALIHGWYGTDLSSPSQLRGYLPATYSSDINSSPVTERAYLDIYAPMCRSCHIANGVYGGGFPDVATVAELRSVLMFGNVCNPASSPIMPNAKVTFDRLWTTHVGPQAAQEVDPGYTDLVQVLEAFLTQTGSPPGTSCGLP
jgi:mono/diheme cytochrome c family protein